MDSYDLQVDLRVGPSLRTLNSSSRARVRKIMDQMRDDLAFVVTGENVTRIPDKAILDRDDPALSFYQLRDSNIEVGFVVDRFNKVITITSVKAL